MVGGELSLPAEGAGPPGILVLQQCTKLEVPELSKCPSLVEKFKPSGEQGGGEGEGGSGGGFVFGVPVPPALSSFPSSSVAGAGTSCSTCQQI